MKGTLIIRLKLLQRTVALLGVGALVAGASVLGATQAQASLGTQPGNLSFSPATGPATTTGITYSTTTACPAGNNGSAIVRLIDPANPNTESAGTNLTQVNNSVTTPFSGTFDTTFATVEEIFPSVVGTTSEVAVYCFSGPSATGTAAVVQDVFVTISADGSTYTESVGTTVTPPQAVFTASPATAAVGQTVTLTEEISPSNAGSVQFSVNGTAIGAPVPLTNGTATTTTSFAAPGTEALSAAYTLTGSSPGVTSTLSYTVTSAPANPNTIPLAVTVPPIGAFTLTVNTTDTVTLKMNGNTAMAMTSPIVVSDTRNTFPGWSLSAQASDWIGSGRATGATISGNQLGWTPTSGTSPLTQGVTLGGAVAPGSPGLGSNPAVLAVVGSGLGNGYGTTTLGAGLTLAIPTPQAAGPYTSGLSLTSVSTTP